MPPPPPPLLTRLRHRYLGHPVRTFLTAVQLLAAGHVFVTYGYEWKGVSGPSMLPGWEIWGEGAVVSKLYRRGRDIRVGDLVKFKVPVTEEEAIKRVAGLPGDYVLVHSPTGGRDEMIQVRFVTVPAGTDGVYVSKEWGRKCVSERAECC